MQGKSHNTQFDKVWEKSKKELYKAKFPEEIFNYIQNGKALDLGCGEGTNATYLIEKGFDVYAIDISEVGIQKTKEKSKKIHTKIGNIYHPLPYEDNFFNLICSFQAMNHNTLEPIITLLKEIKRIIKPGGIFAVKLADKESKTFSHIKDEIYKNKYGTKIKLIDEQTYIPLEGDEKGLIHYLFYQDQFTKEMEKLNFKLLKERKSGSHFISIFQN